MFYVIICACILLAGLTFSVWLLNRNNENGKEVGYYLFLGTEALGALLINIGGYSNFATHSGMFIGLLVLWVILGLIFPVQPEPVQPTAR